jgi:hypothetical protein
MVHSRPAATRPFHWAAQHQHAPFACRGASWQLLRCMNPRNPGEENSPAQQAMVDGVRGGCLPACRVPLCTVRPIHTRSASKPKEAEVHFWKLRKKQACRELRQAAQGCCQFVFAGWKNPQSKSATHVLFDSVLRYRGTGGADGAGGGVGGCGGGTGAGGGDGTGLSQAGHGREIGCRLHDASCKLCRLACLWSMARRPTCAARASPFRHALLRVYSQMLDMARRHCVFEHARYVSRCEQAGSCPTWVCTQWLYENGRMPTTRFQEGREGRTRWQTAVTCPPDTLQWRCTWPGRRLT